MVERRMPDRAELRTAIAAEHEALRRLGAIRWSTDNIAIAESEAELQSARNVVLALRLKHRM
jgi:hypothetical protein